MSSDQSDASSLTIHGQQSHEPQSSFQPSRTTEPASRVISRKPLPAASRAPESSGGRTNLSTKREEGSSTPEATKPLAGPTHARKHPSRITHLLLDTWLAECVCLVLGLSGLIAIFSLLVVFHSQPLRRWHSELSINTILSGLATAMKACTMLATAAAIGQLKWTWFNRKERPLQDLNIYDGASRGVIGAINLLHHLRFWHLASVGCFITILLLASDAFVQASVNIAVRPIQSFGTASVPIAAVPRMNNYDDYLGKHPMWLDNTLGNVNNQMRLGIYTAFVDNSNTKDNRVTTVCPSGN